MKENYLPFIERLIDRYEGGYGWHPKDPGGPTNFGITCFDLAEHRGQQMDSMAAWAVRVRQMPKSEAEDIYKAKYATAIAFDDLKSGIDTVMMDYAVNSGVSRAIRVACAIVKHALPQPVRMTPAILELLKEYNTEDFISEMCAERLRFMHAIDGGKAWITFGGGWGARVADLRTYSMHIAKHITPPEAPEHISYDITPKAVNVPKKAGTATTGGMVGVGVATHEFGIPWWGVAIAVVTIGVAGVAYETWHAERADAANLKVHI